MTKLVAIAVALVVMSAVTVFASGQFVFPGARAVAMGSAYIGVADDLTALYWNPAGLTQLQDRQSMFSTVYVMSEVKSNRSLTNTAAPDLLDGGFPIQKVYPTEPSEFSSKIMTARAFLPFIAANRKISDITIAGGVYAIGGGAANWSDTVAAGVDTLNADVNGSLGYVIGNVSAAKDVMPDVSVGLGLNYIYAMDNYEAKKSYVRAAGSLLPSDYQLSMAKNATGGGIQFSLGTMYKPVEILRLGLVYRNGTILKLSGKAKLYRAGLATSGLANLDYSTDYSQNTYYPTTYGVGAAYEAAKDITLSASSLLTKYTELRDETDYSNEAVYKDTNASKNYNDVTQVMLGAEYRINEKYAVRAGFQTDPGPVPSDKISLLETKHHSHNIISAGLGYTTARLRSDISYTYSMSNKPSKDGREFDLPAVSLRYTLGYDF